MAHELSWFYLNEEPTFCLVDGRMGSIQAEHCSQMLAAQAVRALKEALLSSSFETGRSYKMRVVVEAE